MATVSRGLPAQPHLDVPKREARALLAAWRARRPEALERIRNRHPRFGGAAGGAALATADFKLGDAQCVIAREYGLPSWAALKRRIEAHGVAGLLRRAIERDEPEAVVAILRAHPEMLHLPVWSANWGPPMSHAANLGRLRIVEAVSALGARDHQHAFDRALLQGRIECARWLHAHGATLAPGLVMGCCETLKPEGFDFLLELGAPLTDAKGDRLAPLALTLETYGRHPAGKHALLARFAERGYTLPDTPAIAVHRGDVARLRAFLREDPGLLRRQFALREIFPAACGCAADGHNGLHWTPIDGGTLLHLAVDFREAEVFAWLLEAGADPDARAAVDADGYGGHTPLFNAVVAGPWDDTTFVAGLLRHGASPGTRATLRKFLDWCEEPRWHEARDVTPAQWADGFPDRGFVNCAARAVLGEVGGGT